MTSRKSRTIALLLCIFAGYFGAHRFYVGKIGTGVVWLCTCGLCGFGWFFDLYKITIGGFTDKNGDAVLLWEKPDETL